MKKFLLFFCLIFLIGHTASARHIKGGWIYYEYAGPGNTANTSVYKITVYLFKDCIQTGPFPSALSIYDAVTNTLVRQVTGTTTSYLLQTQAKKSTFDPCLSNPPNICYQIYTYTNTLTLPDNPNGYLVVAQDANRIQSIVNITNSSTTGISFVSTIPGTLNNIDYHVNTSPFFNFKDTAILCYNEKFTYQFSASDADGDSLTYSFGNGINGTQAPTAPPYSALTYTTGFSGLNPLGGAASIDSVTGLISGTAPSVNGEYVIAVYVHEWRKGVLINSTRKELQITVGNCSLSAASLKNLYLNCDTYQFSFQNETLASNITSYLWDFGVTNSTKDTSSKPTPSFTYADTGTYTVKLLVENTGGCKDSAKSTVKVYPGFTPAFTVAGSCYQTPIRFTNTSFVKYGTISSLFWDFGDTNTLADTANTASPQYQYAAPGNHTVVFTISSSVGCTGTISKIVTVNDKPFIKLPFTDTLICSIDSLPLNAEATGAIKWSPAYNISNTGVLNPIVFPKDTTTYTLTVTDQGCIDSAKIKVNVLQFITVKLGLDTGICKTDSITLRPVSDALNYRWRESLNAGSMNHYNTKYPHAAPLATTTYYVTANLGYCQDSAKITVNVSPYPVAKLGNDTAICFGSRIQLRGNYQGVYYAWSPTTSLINSNTLQPVAGPVKTTSYILTAQDTLYCPKKVSDTIVVRVIQPFSVYAGKDTSVAIGQALQLMAMGSDSAYSYLWTPSDFLNADGIFNPVATITATNIDSIRYQVLVTTPEGCTSTDDLWVRVFKGGPDILVPSAFTPNGDGKNDQLRPVLIGISKLHYFNIYNRWGMLVFSTSEVNTGWDGSIKGTPQASGTFVYTALGQDSSGKQVKKSGTVVLIR